MEEPQTAKTTRIRDRAVIQFCFNLHLTQTETFSLVIRAFPHDYPSPSLISDRYKFHAAGGQSLEEKKRGGKQRDPEDIATVADYVHEHRSASIRSISFDVDLSRSTVKSILEKNLHVQKLRPIYEPHTLTEAQRQQRIDDSRDMLDILMSDAENEFKHIITGDETWVNFRNDEDFIWGSAADPRPVKSRNDFHQKKVMISVFWSVDAFLIVKPLHRGDTVNALFFQENVLMPLHEQTEDLRAEDTVWLHYDNASPHKATSTLAKLAQCGFHRMSHPPNSPALAPSDFSLFGQLKEKLKGFTGETEDAVVEHVKVKLNEITREDRLAIFRHWIVRLQKVFEVDGDHVSRFF
jgi:hypothetical protein